MTWIRSRSRRIEGGPWACRLAKVWKRCFCGAAVSNRETGPGGELSLRPNYAGLLLFGRHPQRWLPNATILAARFSGAAFADHYLKQDIAGTLVDQLHQVEAFFYQNLPSVVRLMGLAHAEALEYPPEAVRELLVNAVAHRDTTCRAIIST